MKASTSAASLLVRNPSRWVVVVAPAALVLVTGVGATPVLAADAPGDTLEEMVVTAPRYVPTTDLSATKIAIPLIETPQAISVITRDQMDVLNFQNLEQAVRYTSGVIGENFGPDERYDWLTLRGFQPVEYIDGLQAPVGSTQNVGVDLYGAESVEILKGPSGVLYGQTPPGGLVNVTMRRPQDKFHAETLAQVGTFNDKQLAGDITGALVGDGVLEGRFTGLWRDRGIQEDFVKSKRRFVAPALTWNIGSNTHLTLLSYYQKDELTGDGGGFLPAVGTIMPNPNGHIQINFDAGEPGYNKFTREQFAGGYEFSHAFSDAVILKQNVKYSRANSYSQSVYGAGLQADRRTLNRYNFIFPEDIKQAAIDTRVELRGATGVVTHTALVGVDYRDLKNKSDLGFGFGPPLDLFNPVYGKPNPPLFLPTYAYLRQEQRQTGAYGQDEMSIDHWRVTLSARQDWLLTKDTTTLVSHRDSASTYRAGVNYVLDSGLAPYAAYSTSFLPVSGADFNGTVFVPSKGKQIEAGLKFEPKAVPRGVNVFASAAVYDLKQNHVLTNDPNHAFMFVQTGEVEVKGVELEAVARIYERLSLNASYAYTDSQVTKSNGPDLGKQVPIVAPHKASLFADYTEQTGPLAGAGAGVGLRFLGSSYGDPANSPALRSHPVTLLDALVHYNWHAWSVKVNASNLLDKTYIQRCSTLDQCFYASRRNVFLTVGRTW
jgi:iron complex outermembrane receptor protein